MSDQAPQKYNPGLSFRPSRGMIPSEGHYGRDFPADRGTPIRSATSGEVYFSGLGSVAGKLGNVVIVKTIGNDGRAYYHLYAHQDGKQMPAVGTKVSAGDIVGEVGNTGTEDIHLHYQIYNDKAPIVSGTGGGIFSSAPKNIGEISEDPDKFTQWGPGGVYNENHPKFKEYNSPVLTPSSPTIPSTPAVPPSTTKSEAPIETPEGVRLGRDANGNLVVLPTQLADASGGGGYGPPSGTLAVGTRDGGLIVSTPLPNGDRLVRVLGRDGKPTADPTDPESRILVGAMSPQEYERFVAAASQLPTGAITLSSERGEMSWSLAPDADLSPSAIQAPSRFYPDSAQPSALAIKVLADGSRILIETDPETGKQILSVVDRRGEVKVIGEPTSAQAEELTRPLPSPSVFETVAGSVFSRLGSLGGTLLANGDPVLGTAIGVPLSVLTSAFGSALAKTIETGSVSQGFAGFTAENLGASLKSAGIGAITSLATGAILNAVGLKGPMAGLANSVVSTLAADMATQLVTTGSISSISWASLQTAALSWVGSTVGGMLVKGPNSSMGQAVSGVIQAGAVAAATASISGALGTAMGVALAGVVFPLVGAFVGTVLGNLIGGLFNRQRNPYSNAEVVAEDGVYVAAPAGAEHMSQDATLQPAQAVAARANLILASIGGRIGDQGSVTQRITWYQGGYRMDGGPDGVIKFKNAEEAIDHATVMALKEGKIAGGDMYMKRALYRSDATTFEALSADLLVAKDYRYWRENKAEVQAAIDADKTGKVKAGIAAMMARAAFLKLDEPHESDRYTVNGHIPGMEQLEALQSAMSELQAGAASWTTAKLVTANGMSTVDLGQGANDSSFWRRAIGGTAADLERAMAAGAAAAVTLGGFGSSDSAFAAYFGGKDGVALPGGFLRFLGDDYLFESRLLASLSVNRPKSLDELSGGVAFLGLSNRVNPTMAVMGPYVLGATVAATGVVSGPATAFEIGSSSRVLTAADIGAQAGAAPFPGQIQFNVPIAGSVGDISAGVANGVTQGVQSTTLLGSGDLTYSDPLGAGANGVERLRSLAAAAEPQATQQIESVRQVQRIEDDGRATANLITASREPEVPPSARPDQAVSAEDDLLFLSASSLLANDEGIGLQLTGVSSANGIAALTQDGRISFRPGQDFNGVAILTYSAVDARGRAITGELRVTVTPVNDAPVTIPAAAAGVEDTALVLSRSQLLAGTMDVDDPTSSLRILDIASVVGGRAELTAAGEIRFVPTADFYGEGVVRYAVSDGKGGLAIAEMRIMVEGRDDAPRAQNDRSETTQDRAITFDTAWLMANDGQRSGGTPADPSARLTDVDGQAIQFRGIVGASHGVAEMVNGKLVFTPESGFVGTASVTYEVMDSGGLTSRATLAIAVRTPRADALPGDDDFFTLEDQAIEISSASLLENDNLTGGRIVSVDGAVGGTVSLGADGQIRFAPHYNSSETGLFTYTALDENNQPVTHRVVVTVAEVNDIPVAGADIAATQEDAAVRISVADLLLNDRDEDDQRLSIVSVSDARGGVAELGADGVVTFTPTANVNDDLNGPSGFSYLLSDGRGGETTGQVTVNVAAVQDAPEAVDDAVSATEDTPITFTMASVLANDLEVDRDPLTVVSIQDPVNGTVTLDQGVLRFVPDADYYGPASFTYTIDDGHGNQSTATVRLDIEAVNDAPRLTAETVNATEDQLLTVSSASLLANDHDVDNAVITITAVDQAQGGVVSLAANGEITFTPDADFFGDASFRYQVEDGVGGVSYATATIAVAGVQDAPVAADDAYVGTEDVDLSISAAALTSNDRDVDRDPLTISWVGSAVGGVVSLDGNGDVLFQPTQDYFGTASFRYRIDDGFGNSSEATATIELAAVNDAPRPGAESFTVVEDNALLIIPGSQLLANDYDVEGDSFDLTAVANPAHGTVEIQPDGSILFTPDPDYFGTTGFDAIITDEHGASVTQRVSVSVTGVNDQPLINDIAITRPEDTQLAIPASLILAGATDVDGDTLFVTSVYGASDGATASYDSVAGVVHFNPLLDWYGTTSFQVAISDGAGGSAVSTITVTLNPVNDAPRLGADVVATIEETPVLIQATDLLLNDYDVEGDAISVTSVGNAIGGTVSMDGPDGEITFTPNLDFFGAGSFDYTVTDAIGDSTTHSVTVNVANVNDAPIVFDRSITADEDTRLTLTPGYLFADRIDADGDTLFAVSVTGAPNGSTSIDGSGNVIFQPLPDWSGSTSFQIGVSDGNGGTATTTVSVTLTPVNDAPRLTGETVYGGIEDSPLTFNAGQLLANDYDVEGGALSITGLGSVFGGSASFNGSTITYVPNPNFYGSGYVDYQVTDGQGGYSTGRATIDVQGVNDLPVAAGETFNINEDQGAQIAASVFLANDIDIDGTLSIQSAFNAYNGSVGYDGNYVYFIPTANYSGQAGFTYSVVDNQGGVSNQVQVTFNVAAVNDAPITTDDVIGGFEDITGSVAVSTLLSNDRDIDSPSIFISSVSASSYVTSVWSDGSTIYYQTQQNFNGIAAFNYTASDGSASTVGTVYVVVNSVNDAPVAAGASASVADTSFQTETGGSEAGQIITTVVPGVVSGTVGFYDVDGGGLSVGLVSNPDGRFSIDGAGNWTFTGNRVGGVYNAIYRVTDPQGASADAVITVNYSALPDVPPIDRGDGVGPVVLDLNGDGVSFIGLDDDVPWVDLDGDGLEQRTSWIGPDDAFLMADLNGDGRYTASDINFAAATTADDTDMEAVQALFDENNDGRLTKDDPMFAELVTWRDQNQDGRVQAAETQSLQAAGIVSITVDAPLAVTQVGDVTIHRTSSFERVDGTSSAALDVTLHTDRASERPAADASIHLAAHTSLNPAINSAAGETIAVVDGASGQTRTVGSQPTGTVIPASGAELVVATVGSEPGSGSTQIVLPTGAVSSQSPSIESNLVAPESLSHTGTDVAPAAAILPAAAVSSEILSISPKAISMEDVPAATLGADVARLIQAMVSATPTYSDQTPQPPPAFELHQTMIVIEDPNDPDRNPLSRIGG